MAVKESSGLKKIKELAEETYGVKSLETMLAVIADVSVSDEADEQEIDGVREFFRQNSIDPIKLKKQLESSFESGDKGNEYAYMTFFYKLGSKASSEKLDTLTIEYCLREIISNPTNLMRKCMTDNGKTASNEKADKPKSGSLDEMFLGLKDKAGLQKGTDDSNAKTVDSKDKNGAEAKEEIKTEHNANPFEKIENERDVEALVKEVKSLQAQLSGKIMGQENAIGVLTNGLFQSEMQYITGQHGIKPSATFLFAGPPGVGKTYLAKTTAEILQLPFKQFDMSEYTQSSGVDKFAGIPKNYSGKRRGLVTEFVADNPRCVLLFDEIEKASQEVILLFLQILDGGRLKDNYSDEEVSFSDAIIIFTTNAGRKIYENSEKLNLSSISRKVIIKALREDVNPRTGQPYFPAAICSRLASGNVVMFNHIEAHNLYKISVNVAEKIMNNMNNTLNVDFKMNSNVYSTLLFSEGGHTDARSITGVTEKFLNSEIYELYRLVASERVSTGVKDIQKVQFEVSIPDRPEIMRLYVPKGNENILIFAGEAEASLCKYGDNKYFISHDISESEEIIRENDIDLVYFDFTYGLKEEKGKYLNIEDISSVGRDFFWKLQELESDIPTYIIQTDKYRYSEEEKVSFSKLGVRDIVDLTDSRQNVQEVVERISLNINQQHNMDLLASSNQVITYNTAQELTDDGSKAIVRIFDLKLKKAVDANDKDSIMSGASRPDVRFDDIIGAKDAKDELQFFVSYLKNPRKYKEMGAAAPKGIMFYGPPGTGKTMLAKAVAGEADVTFVATEGNKFLSKWVGEGPERVHQIFSVARKYAPSVIFIDEIDAIIKARRESVSGYDNSDIITAFLAEMDGFKTNSKKPVFIMAATNANLASGSGGLDPAILRRFDRRIFVDLPDKEERMEFMRKKQEENSSICLSDDEMESIASRAIGMSFANMESVYEMAIRMAIRENAGAAVVNDSIFDEAFQTFQDGESREKETVESIMRTARHEAGHALLSVITGGHPSYITIVSRSNYGGYVMHGEENKGVYTKQELLDLISVSLAGRASEIVYYGEENGLTTGASSDFEHATKLAKSMICDYSMYDDIGLSVIDESALGGSGISERLKAAVDDILKERMEYTIEVIRNNTDRMNRMVDTLMKRNHLNKQEIEDIFDL